MKSIERLVLIAHFSNNSKIIQEKHTVKDLSQFELV